MSVGRVLIVAALSLASCRDADDPLEDDVAGGSDSGESSESSGTEADGPTFHGEIAGVFAQHCNGCHAQDGIAPFTFDTPETAAQLAPAIAQAVQSGSMPPWHIGDDGSCNRYRDSRRLDDDTIDTVLAWADAGAPIGEAAPPPEPAPEVHLSSPDLSLSADAPYTPPPGDDYRCFVLDPELSTDHFLTGFEVHPDAPSIVHHVVMFSVDTEAEEQTARDLDAESEEPGYPCFGGANTGGGRSLLVWTPGTSATEYPEDTGLRLYAGRPLVMQVHYFGGGVPDQTRIDLAIADEVEAEAVLTGTFDLSLNIPPGQAAYEAAAALPLPAWSTPMTLHAVYPHMHRYGRQMQVHYDRAGQTTCLADVPDYDFDWQQFFFYEEPIVLEPPGGGHFRISCTFDSRGADEPILFGEGTDDEMCIVALYATF